MAELGSRILWALPAIALGIFMVAQGGAVFSIGAALFGLACLHELFRMYERVRAVRLAAFISLLGMVAAALLGDERQVLLAAAASIPLVFLLGLAMPNADRLTASISLTLLGVFWIGFGVSHAVLLRELDHGGGLVLAVLLGAFLGDTGAYVGGRMFGTRRLAPRVSPKKTWEGLIAGFAVAVFVVWWYGLSNEWMGGTRGLLLGIAVGVAAPIGDLFESKVKRDAQVKDAGGLFGPHGGALDRLDAALFALVAGYYAWLALL
jgi:phosphatidate cytidylyltransferase